jgi:acetyl esterase/lipase
MPFVVSIGLLALVTALALAPVRRPRRLARASWLLSMVVTEQPFLAFYYLVAAVLLALAEGDVGTPAGGIGLGLALLVTAGLVVVAARQLRARRVVEGALRRGLGARAAQGLQPPGRPGRLPWGRIVLAPFMVRRRDVERIANVRYGPAGRRNLLDVYRHRSHPTRAPVFVYLHGGGFFSGRKNKEARPLLYRLASEGWLCISANYRLRPAATFPDHLVDVKKVIAWVRAHGTSYGADPSTVVVAGSSAGGTLAVLAALTADDPRLQPGFEDADTAVAGVVSLYGYYGRYYDYAEEDRLPSSPLRYSVAGAPPMFLAHGDQDTYVPVDGARALVDHLRHGSPSPVVYAELPGAQHAFDLFHSIRFDTVVDGVVEFLDRVDARSAREVA